MPRPSDTIAALATPAGTAALALIRISGPDTKALARALGGAEPAARRAVHRDYRDRGGRLLDDVVLTFYAGPRSATGEDTLEVCCHGNPLIVQRILEDLQARGCRPAGPGEFTQRAFLNGRMDLSQAEAVMDVIRARSDRALAAAHRQLRGALGRRVDDLVHRLLGVLARVEAYIDFPDEDLPTEDRGLVEAEVRGLQADSRHLLATSHYGQLLRDGIRTVIVGAPNVGKSSLLNRLVGEERALVSPEPGTTRDFIEERITAGPHVLRLIDTAGLNASPAPLESLGMEKTRARLADADLVLLVVDASRPEEAPPAELDQLPGQKKCFKILNKIDLCNLRPSPSTGVWPVSATTGEGIEPMVAAIVAWADGFQSDHGEESVAVSARHAMSLREADACLGRSLEHLHSPTPPPELLASELRGALNALGDITGRVDNERMLDQLFATFCIGK